MLQLVRIGDENVPGALNDQSPSLLRRRRLAGDRNCFLLSDSCDNKEHAASFRLLHYPAGCAITCVASP